MFLRELRAPVREVKGAGPALCAKLQAAGIETVHDLLTRYPRQGRYEDHIRPRALATVLPPGGLYRSGGAPSDDARHEVNTRVQIVDTSSMYIQKRAVPCLVVNDGTATATLLAFKDPAQARSLKTGVWYLLWGVFGYSEKYRKIQSSDFEIEREDAAASVLLKKHFGVILPVYRLEGGLRQWHFRTLVQNALTQYAQAIDDELPPALVEKYGLLAKKNAVRAIHFPRGFDELDAARHTLIYEELFCLARTVAERKRARSLNTAPLDTAAQTADETADEAAYTPLQTRLLERLPFALTSGQERALLEINASMAAPAMARLLQGDVGSGKTLVCFLAALKAVEAGGQAVILAPTELLAYQHAENAARLLEPLGARVAFLTGNVKSQGRKHLLAALASGEIDIAVGTHALFSRDVQYRRLRLVVIDEQHRFGVTQRQAILDKGEGAVPHLLMMSATPIPRTLAQTVFGDMDVSVIRGMPPGRTPVQTRTFSENNAEKVYALVERELRAGHQAYFVYPLIGTGDGAPSGDGADALKDAQSMARRLSCEVFPRYKTALLHSKLDDEEKKRIMAAFRQNEIQILAATSVVEVGVDVPNATCMVIEHAERFGLAALHQLRGRVGRGTAPSTCFLVWTDPLEGFAREASGEKLEVWQKRLKVMRETNDGFAIAEEDLKLRGPGQITGTEQSGYTTFGLANLIRDEKLFLAAREDVLAMLS
jgi:ATP-dependent DNA helicase RecG